MVEERKEKEENQLNNEFQELKIEKPLLRCEYIKKDTFQCRNKMYELKDGNLCTTHFKMKKNNI